MAKPPLETGQILGKTYRLERVIGEGGVGVVYQAAHLRVNRAFAIKVLYPFVCNSQSLLVRFRQEAEIACALDHPHIVEVIDFDRTTEGIPYLVMELLVGEDLSQLLRRQKRLDLTQVTTIFRETSSALLAAHARGVIHRDLKPSNIFLCRKGERNDFVKVVDFGLSKIVGSQRHLTTTHGLMGTPTYMSPEQAQEQAASVTPRTDVYAMGTILFEMLAGRPPFNEQSLPLLLHSISYRDPPSLTSLRSDLPGELARVIERALRKRPDERYPDMDVFFQEFAEAARARVTPGEATGLDDPAPEGDTDSVLPTTELPRPGRPPPAVSPAQDGPSRATGDPDQLASAPPASGSRLRVARQWVFLVVILAPVSGLIVFALGEWQRPPSGSADGPIPRRRGEGKSVAGAVRDRVLRGGDAGVRPSLLTGHLIAAPTARDRGVPAERSVPGALSAPADTPARPESRGVPLPRRVAREARHRDRTATLWVSTMSEGRLVPAEIYLDGRHVGQSPLSLEGLGAGARRVEARLAGFPTREKRVVLVGGRKTKVLLVLTR